MHAHSTYMGGGCSYLFAESFVIRRKALIDGMQTMCTRLGGDAIVDGGLKRFSIEGILLVRRVAAVSLLAD